MERVEADADRQRDLQQRQRQPEADASAALVDRVDEEPVVLEPAEQPEVADDRGEQECLAQPLAGSAVHGERASLVEQRACGQQQRETDVGVAVEEVRRGDDERLPDPLVWHQQPGQRQNDEEESRELDRRKDHG